MWGEGIFRDFFLNCQTLILPHSLSNPEQPVALLTCNHGSPVHQGWHLEEQRGMRSLCFAISFQHHNPLHHLLYTSSLLFYVYYVMLFVPGC